MDDRRQQGSQFRQRYEPHQLAQPNFHGSTRFSQQQQFPTFNNNVSMYQPPHCNTIYQQQLHSHQQQYQWHHQHHHQQPHQQPPQQQIQQPNLQQYQSIAQQNGQESTIQQQIIYEHKRRARCRACKKFGHQLENCPKVRTSQV